MLTHTSSGGVSVNDTLMHVAGSSLKFGGVGDSGIGNVKDVSYSYVCVFYFFGVLCVCVYVCMRL